ncbi:MAG: hypothetical protein U9P72_03040 [Campylobacterota bacterium]|nr:hypothetical protein [Campylobacterota bacterium]
MKKMLTVSAVTAMLLFSGCENEAEDRMLTQQMLDRGDFDGVISALEDKELKTDEDNLKLASAYMDKAGFSVTDLVSIVADAEDDAETSFASFITSVSEDKTAETLDNLQKAIDYYSELVDIDDSANLSKSRSYTVDEDSEVVDDYSDELDLDTNELFLGLAYIAKAATVLSYMGDVAKLEDSGTDGNLLASGCAMAKVYAPSENLDECMSVTYTGSLPIYEKIDVILANGDGKTYHYLANSTKEHLVLTDYTTNFNLTGYPNPVKDENLTVLGALLDTLNSAFDFIVSAAPDDVKEDIVSYRDELNSDSDPKISVTELTNYLNAEMAKN